MSTVDWFADWQRFYSRAHATGHRTLLLLEGSATWTLDQVSALLAADTDADCLWFSERAPEGAWCLPAGRIHHELGREAPFGVFDVYSGFHPDALAALAGSLKGGGVLIVLCPPLAQWGELDDPYRRRIAVEPGGVAAVKSHFLQRAAWILGADRRVARVSEEGGVHFPEVSEPPWQAPQPDEWGCVTACQRATVAAVVDTALGPAHAPLVIQADRGRGKSAALGLALQRLRAHPVHVVVTAPRPETIDTLKRFSGDALAVTFYAPDRLLEEYPPADLLVVDEAAALAPELLKRMLQQYPRVVFATTIDGYEGTGRGFATRFQQHLQRQYPAWQQQALDTPIRWQAGCALEALLNHLLLLKPQAAELNSSTPTQIPAFERFLPPDHTESWSDEGETQLQQLFELLRSAHYRTRPSDLRTLLDGGNIRLYLLRRQRQVLAVAMLAEEGELPQSLRNAIVAGKRRPHGQVLPQTLAVHADQEQALSLRLWRVVRIAVQPALQNQGWGAHLLQCVVERAGHEGVDGVGSLFSGHVPVLRFWQQNGFQLARVGYTRESTSGAHSLLVLKGLTAAGKRVEERAAAGFARDFSVQVQDSLRELPDEMVECIQQHLASGHVACDQAACDQGVNHQDANHQKDERDQHRLQRYLSGYTPYENVMPSVQRCVRSRLEDTGTELDHTQHTHRLIELKLFQLATWEQCVRQFSFTGRKQAQARLREALTAFFQQVE